MFWDLVGHISTVWDIMGWYSTLCDRGAGQFLVPKHLTKDDDGNSDNEERWG